MLFGQDEWGNSLAISAFWALVPSIFEELNAFLVDHILVLYVFLELQYYVVAYRLHCPSFFAHFHNDTGVHMDIIV